MLAPVDNSSKPDLGTPSVSSPRLHRAAQQFEAMLLKEILKPLGEHEDESGAGDVQQGGASPLAGFGLDAVAESMAKSGALGFARRIEDSLQQHAGRQAASVKTAP